MMRTERLNPLTETHTAVKATPYSRGPWQVVECLETGMVYLANPPQYADLVEEYAWEKTSAAEAKRRRQAAPILARLSHANKAMRRKMLKRERIEKVAAKVMRERIAERGAKSNDKTYTMVDVGCGQGDKLMRIARDFQATTQVKIAPLGIEISAQLAKQAHQQFVQLRGRCVHATAVDGLQSLPSNSLDLVILCSYLEHELQPKTVLIAIADKLKQAGKVIIKVPNFACWNRHLRQQDWCGFRYPDHVNYFTPNTLKQIIIAAGLKLWKMNFYDRIPTNDNVWAIATK